MPHGAEWLVFLGSTALFALLPGPTRRHRLPGLSRHPHPARPLARPAVPGTADRGSTPLVFVLLGAIVLTVGLAADLGVAMLGAGALLAVTEQN